MFVDVHAAANALCFSSHPHVLNMLYLWVVVYVLLSFLRTDMLALILSLANVGAYAEVLVLDMLGGLLTVSVAERLGGNLVFHGHVLWITVIICIFLCGLHIIN